jgi:hypothetical protein
VILIKRLANLLEARTRNLRLRGIVEPLPNPSFLESECQKLKA